MSNLLAYNVEIFINVFYIYANIFPMYFANNIKFLRKNSEKSQDEVATLLNIKRTSLSGYENGSVEPNLETLLRMSSFYKVPVDYLLKKNLAELEASELQGVQKGALPDLSGSRLRVLATTVNADNEENIELVPVKAKAGYTAGYGDPDFIKVLQTFNLPFLDRNRKYRTFQISGNSMPPVPDGAWVTGEYVQNWNMIKDRHPYLVVTKDDGVVFKTVYNKVKESGTLLLCSTNPEYQPYEIPISSVLEIWKFTNFISNELPEPNVSNEELTTSVLNLQKEVIELKNTFKRQSQSQS
jgi:transcriptional regulator with XRE-family HTH domain